MDLQKVIELDHAYLSTFSNRIDRPWGVLFYNQDQPDYYDANHANIQKAVEHPEHVIEEVTEFYRSRQLKPRFYIYNLDKQEPFLNALKAGGYKLEELSSPVQWWKGKEVLQGNSKDVQIEKVTDDSFYEALEIECQIQELGGREVREKSFPEEYRNPAYTHYILRFKGAPCSTACLFTSGNEARLESVATLKEYRGKGLIGDLIRYIQKEAAGRGFEGLWVFPISDRVAKVYEKAGFKAIGNVSMAHAFLSGRSIKEIQGR